MIKKLKKNRFDHEFHIKLPLVQRSLNVNNGILADIIMTRGDVQQRRTNVQADMTEWELHRLYEPVQALCTQALEVAEEIYPATFNDSKLYTRRCWGASYSKDDFTKEHNHANNVYSWCYYISMPEGASPIIFPEANLTITPNEGDLILFSGLVRHSVPPSDYEGKRIMIAGNINVR